jgi:hypothetical protein
MADLPKMEEWLALSEDERCRCADSWNPYCGEGAPLLKEIVECFRRTYGHLPGLVVEGFGLYHGGYWVIGVAQPVIFDRRLLPKTYLV